MRESVFKSGLAAIGKPNSGNVITLFRATDLESGNRELKAQIRQSCNKYWLFVLALWPFLPHAKMKKEMFQEIFLASIMAFVTLAQVPPAICLWDPVLNVAAGSDVTARITSSSSRRCLAELAFGDTTYLPITWSFSSSGCLGVETATIALPIGVPNGDAFLTW